LKTERATRPVPSQDAQNPYAARVVEVPASGEVSVETKKLATWSQTGHNEPRESARRAHLTSSLSTLIDALQWFTGVATGVRNRLELVPSYEPLAPADLDDAEYVAQSLLDPPEAAQDAAGEVLGLVRKLRSGRRLIAVAGGRT